MKISNTNTASTFNARLCGDYRQVIAIAKEGGLPGKAVERLLKEVQTVLPNKKDRVFFIFRKPNEIDFWYDFKIRSQVEILKDGDVLNLQGLRANVYPFKGEQKDLLTNFVDTLKKLVKGEIKSERQRFFYPEEKHPWLYAYGRDKRIKTGWVNFDEGLET